MALHLARDFPITLEFPELARFYIPDYSGALPNPTGNRSTIELQGIIILRYNQDYTICDLLIKVKADICKDILLL